MLSGMGGLVELLLESASRVPKGRGSKKAAGSESGEETASQKPAHALEPQFEIAVQDTDAASGSIDHAVASDNFAITYKEDRNSNPVWTIFDASGKRCTGNVHGISVTGVDLSEIKQGRGKKNLSTRDTDAESLSLQDALRALGDNPDRLSELYNSIQSKQLWTSALNTDETPLIQRRIKGMTSEGTKIILQTYDKSTVVIETASKEGRALDPSQWQILVAPWKTDSKGVQASTGQPILGRELSLQRDSVSFKIVDLNSGQVLHGEGCGGAVSHPKREGTVIAVSPTGNRITTLEVSSEGKLESSIAACELNGKVKDARISPEGRFLYVDTEAEGGERCIAAVDLSDGKVKGKITNVRRLMHVDQAGTLYFINTGNQLQKASTNSRSFALESDARTPGIRRTVDASLRNLFDLRESIATLALPDISEVRKQESATLEVSPSEVKADIARELEERFAPDIQKLETVQDVLLFERQLRVLALDEKFRGNEECFAPLDDRLRERLNQVKLGALTAEITDLAATLDHASSPREVVEIGQRFDGMLRSRRDLVIRDLEERKRIDDELDRLAALRSEQLEKLVQGVEHGLAEAFEAVSNLAAKATNERELDAVFEEPSGRQLTELLGLASSTELGAKYRAELDKVLDDRRSVLKDASAELERAERVRIAQALQETRALMEDISKSLPEQVKESSALAGWMKRSPLVTAFHAGVLALPEELRKEETSRFDRVVLEFKEALQQQEISQTMRNGKEVQFGKISFPVFEPVPYVWAPKVVNPNRRVGTGQLVFEDSLGRRFIPECEHVSKDLKDSATVEAISQFESDAEKYFSRFSHKVPPFDSKWTLNDHVQKEISEMVRLLLIQEKYHRSIVILEGEAGTGKNVLVDIFCHLTNRQASTFSCHAQAEKEDLTYAFRFDPKKGTYQVDSKFVEALQTPGTVIVLDEINTLPPEVCKMLNPLLDYRRALFLPDGRVIKVHPSVLLVGTMNPQHYLGVKPLSQEVKSRSRIEPVDYPPEKKGRNFTPYEAEMLAKYRPSLAPLTQKDFEKAWDYVINGAAENGADRFVTPDMLGELKNLHQIVRTANRVREAYSAYRTGTSNDAVEFVFSLRESVDIAIELDWEDKVRQAIKSVVLPKISDFAEKKRVEAIIEQA